MAESIDERIVQLTLDNKQFNRASSETIDSLEKLKKTLEFEGAIDSFEEIEKEINKVDFSSINNGVDGVGKSFTILDTITDAVFRNMTNRVIDFGERTIKSLSTDQIITGWNKYAEQTGAVQTIMAATAQQFSDTDIQMQAVNEQLEKLTWFTDETSHKFNDMVGGIGKFTANNVDLETSVKAMEGIATWASLSGANANEASRAIYNLAQAVSVGSVKLIDWRSIENANMGTTEFKQTVIETAQEVGTLVKVTDGLYKTLSGKDVSISNFSENLSAGWFNSEVLLKSLDRYGGFADKLNKFVESAKDGFLTASAMNLIDDFVDGTLNMQSAMDQTGMEAEELTKWLEELGSAENDLGRRAFRAAQETKTFQEAIDYVKEAVSSGWATSFKYIFGDYLEAKEWWSEIAEVMYDAFVVGGEIRNTILSIWKDSGGRDDFLDGIRAGIENITGIIKTFKDAWNEVWFGDAKKQIKNQANLLLDVTRGFRELMESLAPTSATIQNLRTILSSIFSILRSGVKVIKSITRGLSPVLSLLNMISGTILQIIANLASSFSNKLNDFLNEERLNRISQVLNAIGTIISAVINVGLALLLSGAKKVYNVIKDIFRQIGESGGGIKGVFTVLIDTVTDFFNTFITGETIANKVVNGILFVFGGLAEGIKLILDTIAKLITGELTFNDLFSGNGLVSDGINGFSDILTKLNLGDKIQEIIDWLRDFTTELVAADGIIVNFVNNFVAGFKLLWNSVTTILSTLTIDDIKELLLIAILWSFVNQINLLTGAFTGAINAFSSPMKKINSLIDMFTNDTGSKLTKLDSIFKKIQIPLMAVGVALLVSALGQMNQLNWEETQKSVAALGVTLAVLLAVFKKFTDIIKTMPKSDHIGTSNDSVTSLTKSVMFLGVGALMIAQALKAVDEALFDEGGNFDLAKAVELFGVVTALLTSLSGAVILINKFGGESNAKAFSSMAVVIVLAAGLRLVVNSVALLVKTSGANVAAMLTAGSIVSAALIALGGGVALIKNVGWSTALAAVPLIIAFSTGILEIVAATAILAAIAPSGALGGTLATMFFSIVEMAGAIVILGRALKDVSATTMLSISAAMISFGTALAILAEAMLMVSLIDLSDSWPSLLALAVGFAVMSGALGVLSKTLATVNPTVISTIGGTLLIMSSSILVLAASLKVIQGIEWDEIKTGITTIGIMLAAFLALGAVVAYFDTKTFGMVSKSLDLLATSFMKFAGAITILAAGIFLLSAASAAFAIIIAAFQALGKAVGLDLPAAIQTGFDTLELIIREFLAMLRSLAPDILLTLTTLFGIVLAVMAIHKSKIADQTVAIIIAIAMAIKDHAQDLIDALTTVVKALAEADELFDALAMLVGRIAEFLASAFVLAICGALAGIVGGIAGCVSAWLGQGFRAGMIEIEDDMSGQYNESLSKAIDDLNNEQLISKAKGQAFNIAQGIVQGWIDGEENISQEAALSALKAMNAYSNAATGETKKTTDAVMAQLLKGIVDNEKKIKGAGELMAEYEIQGYKDGTDPDEPGDWFRYFAQTIAKQIGLGTDDISGNVYGSGWDMAADYISGWSDNILQNLDIDLPFTNLVAGKRKSKYSLSDRDIEKRNKARRRANELYGVEAIDEVNAGAEKEIDETTPDLGKMWTENLASGIESSSSRAGGAAKTAAQTIADAFSDELDKISRDTQVSDKLFKLWTAQNPTASEMEKTAKEIEYQSEKVALATQKASLTQQIYQQTLSAMGAEAKETHEAYMTMLDDQIALLEAQNKLADLTSNNAKDQKEAWQQYTNLVYQKDNDGKYITDFLKEQGFTMEEISKAYAKEAGYILPTLAKDTSDAMMGIVTSNATGAVTTMATSITEAANASAETLNKAGSDMMAQLNNGAVGNADVITQGLNTSITNATEAAKSTANTKGQEIGLTEDQGNAKGIEENTDLVTDATNEMCDATIKAAESYLEVSDGYSVKFWDIGKYIAEGTAKGITENQSIITDAAEKAAWAAYLAAKAKLGIKSPSKLAAELGMYYDQGLALGIHNYAKTVENSATRMVDDLVDSTSNSLLNQNGINNYLQKMFGLEDEQLHIDVVLDMDASAYDDKISELEKAYLIAQGGRGSYQTNTTMSTIATDDRYISSSLQQLANAEAYRSRQLQSLYDLVDSCFMESKMAAVSALGEAEGQGSVVNNFTQNNYSPKAISRVDTYRQTERQFNAFTNRLYNSRKPTR